MTTTMTMMMTKTTVKSGPRPMIMRRVIIRQLRRRRQMSRGVRRKILMSRRISSEIIPKRYLG